MLDLKMIVGVSENNVIGTAENNIPWRYKEDMQRFKKLTTDKTVIMGRKTFESMRSVPLPNRKNIILSKTLKEVNGCEVYSDPAKLLLFLEGDCWVIGGAEIYSLFMPYASYIDLTIVPEEYTIEPSVKFPTLSQDMWELVYETKTEITDTDKCLIHKEYNNKMFLAALSSYTF